MIHSTHWAVKNPGEADQRMAESKAVRKELGFDPDADDVAPIDLSNAIKEIRAGREAANAELGKTTVELIEAKAELEALSKQEPAVLITSNKVAWNPNHGPCDGAFYAKAVPDGTRELKAQRDELLAACEEFVRKCDAGEARSVRSYAQMKAAIEKCGAKS